MRKAIHIYSRDDGGRITYKGTQGWHSREQVLEYYARQWAPAERERLAGWPHPAVTWHDNVGFGEDRAEMEG